MAARTAEASRHQHVQHQYTPKVYTLYPDPPLRRLSMTQLPPSPSQLLTKSKDKHQQQKQTQQKQQVYSVLKKGVPPSPVSPSSPPARGIIEPKNGFMSTVKDKQNKRGQTSSSTQQHQQHQQQQIQTQARQQPQNATVQWDRTGVSSKQGSTSVQTYHYQFQQEPHYGGCVPRLSVSPSLPHQADQGGQNQEYAHRSAHGHGDRQSGAVLKQSVFPGSTSSPSASSHHHQQQHELGMKQNMSPALSSHPASPPRQGQPSIIPTAPLQADLPALLTDIPTASLCLSFDGDSNHDSADYYDQHQQQALQYQKRLKQKPPRKHDEDDTDDDSEAGALRSYRRSIHQLSISYKGRPGIPNISLFAPHEGPSASQHSRFGSGSASEAQRKGTNGDQKQQLQVQHQGSSQVTKSESTSSLASTNQHPIIYEHSKPRHFVNSHSRSQSNDQPRIERSNTEDTLHGVRAREVLTPGRSISADSMLHRESTRQIALESQSHQLNRSQAHHHLHPSNHQSYSTLTGSRDQHYQLEPRPSHESSQSMRSQYGRGGGAISPNSGGPYPRTIGRNGTFTHHPLPKTARGGVGAGGYGNNNINMHPAHHFPTNGYVRPEEAVGPSNPMPEKAEDYVRQGIELHENGDISKATNYFRIAAELGDPVGMLMYGLSVRHGWGCTANRVLAFQYLQKSAEHAVGDLHSRDSFASSAAKGELVLAIYELGICFRHGWGVERNKKTAAYYFEIAANLGDPDAQNDLAWCYFHGVGVKKDMYKSAKYYRMATAQGAELMGNQWIWKDKYGGPSNLATEKTHS